MVIFQLFEIGKNLKNSDTPPSVKVSLHLKCRLFSFWPWPPPLWTFFTICYIFFVLNPPLISMCGNCFGLTIVIFFVATLVTGFSVEFLDRGGEWSPPWHTSAPGFNSMLFLYYFTNWFKFSLFRYFCNFWSFVWKSSEATKLWF